MEHNTCIVLFWQTSGDSDKAEPVSDSPSTVVFWLKASVLINDLPISSDYRLNKIIVAGFFFFGIRFEASLFPRYTLSNSITWRQYNEFARGDSIL